MTMVMMMMVVHSKIIGRLQATETKTILYLVMVVQGQQLYRYTQKCGSLKQDKPGKYFGNDNSKELLPLAHNISQGPETINMMLECNGKVKIIQFVPQLNKGKCWTGTMLLTILVPGNSSLLIFTVVSHHNYLLITVNLRYRLTVTDIITQSCFKEWEGFTNPYEEIIHLRSHHGIVGVIKYIQF